MRKKELSTDGRRKERGQSERERTDSGGKRDDSWLVNNSKKRIGTIKREKEKN